MRKAVFIICLMFLTSSFAHAATYYVATTGNNNNSGAIGSPFLTIAKALTVMQAGDTLYIRGGTYVEGIADHLQTVPSGTSWANAITIASYTGETATLRPSSGVAVMGFASSSYVIVDRLTLDAINVSHGSCIGDGGPGDSCYGSVIGGGSLGGHHVRYQNCDIKNGYGTNIFLGHSSEVLNSKIHGSRYAYGFYIEQRDVIIENNEIYDNAGYAVQVYNGYEAVADRVIVRNNRMWNNGFNRQVFAMTVGRGTGSKVYNNLIYNNRGGIAVHGTGVEVYNNTIYNNTIGAGIEIGSAVNPVIKNNILYQNALGLINPGGVSIVASNNPTTNPLFINAGGSDFHLQAGSPSIDACLDLSGIFTTDFAYATRTGTWECGAYIYGAISPVNLVFFTPPSAAIVNVPITPAVKVCAQVSGITQTSFSNPIALALTTGTGALTGGGATAPTNGCSSFSISIDTAGADKVATASATGATSIASGAFVTNAAASVVIKTDRILRVP